jgi:hypothetical protein
MAEIRTQMKNPRVVGIVGFLIGTFFGLVILGWWLWPVQWINATPAQLSLDWQKEYLRMSVQSFGATRDAAKAEQQYKALGEGGKTALEEVKKDPTVDAGLTAQYEAAVATGATTAPVTPKKTNWLTILLPLLCVLLLVVVAFLGTECPLAKLYGPQLQKLATEFVPRSVAKPRSSPWTPTGYVTPPRFSLIAVCVPRNVFGSVGKAFRTTSSKSVTAKPTTRGGAFPSSSSRRRNWCV